MNLPTMILSRTVVGRRHINRIVSINNKKAPVVVAASLSSTYVVRPAAVIRTASSSRCSSSSKLESATTATRTISTEQQQQQQDDGDEMSKIIRSRKRTEEQTKVYDALWEKHFQQLQEHVQKCKREEPDRIVPSYPPNNRFLKQWLDNQRKLYRYRILNEEEGSEQEEKDNDSINSLTDERVTKLESLGYPIFPKNGYWDIRFEQLQRFLDVHNGCFPYDIIIDDDSDVTTATATTSFTQEERKLLWWCQRQKKQYKTGTLTSDRINKLESIGFVFDAKKHAWDQHYRDLIEYKKKHGDCLVPMTKGYRLTGKYGALAVWIGVQRYHYKKWKAGQNTSPMTQERFEKLNKVGFIWNQWDAKWMTNYRELKEHVELNGFGSIPGGKRYESLRRWIKRQQKQHELKVEGKKSALTDVREKLLGDLGFPWTTGTTSERT